MPLPTFTLEGITLPRVIFSILPSPSTPVEGIVNVMKKAYRMGIACFDLPSPNHLESFRELKRLTEDRDLLGFPHISTEDGVSFLGRPIHRFEGSVIATLRKNLFPPELVRHLKASGVWNSALFFPPAPPSEVFTQKEIDRFAFDTSRFDRALAPFFTEESSFLILGGRYADWISGLGRIDLLEKMAFKIREKGFIPVFSARWTSFILPKARSIDAAAYAVPINRKWGLFDLAQASALVKKFDRPLIGLNPFADGALMPKPGEALAFLFDELKIHGTIAEMDSEEEGEKILKAAERLPSLTRPQKTGSRRR